MRLTAILSIILFGSTRHIWCGPYDDVDGYKAMILAYRDNRVLLSYPDNALPKNKGGNGKMLCFPRGKPKEMDEGDTRQTAQRELKEETGYELELDEFEYIMEVDDRTKLFVAKIPSNAKAVQGADTHNRNDVWVDPWEVAGCIKNRQDSMAAWHSECYRFQGVEDF